MKLAVTHEPQFENTVVAARRKDLGWLVRVHHINRGVFLALLGVASGTHLWTLQAPAWVWAVMALICYVWPHIAYLRSRGAPDPLIVEKQNFLIETTISGAWLAALGFPLWLSVVIFIGNSINFIGYHGARQGVPRLLAAFIGGALVIWLSGLHYPFKLQVSTLTAAVCVFTQVLYIGLLSQSAFDRARQLRHSNRKLQEQKDEIEALQTLLHEQMLRDPLTGLYNRRHLESLLPSVLARCKAANKTLAVLTVDIDHFKRINENHGHAAGDDLLQTLAQGLQRHMRPLDYAFRLDDEEFMLVLPEAPLETAQARAEALRASFEKTRVRLAGVTSDFSATLSCGVAVFPQHAGHANELVACAAKALADAKAGGRNKVVVYAP